MTSGPIIFTKFSIDMDGIWCAVEVVAVMNLIVILFGLL